MRGAGRSFCYYGTGPQMPLCILNLTRGGLSVGTLLTNSLHCLSFVQEDRALIIECGKRQGRWEKHEHEREEQEKQTGPAGISSEKVLPSVSALPCNSSFFVACVVCATSFDAPCQTQKMNNAQFLFVACCVCYIL